MLNHITIMGRLTRDPEIRYTQSQTPVTSFTLAVDRDFGGRDGGEKQTDFIDCVAWRQTAEFVISEVEPIGQQSFLFGMKSHLVGHMYEPCGKISRNGTAECDGLAERLMGGMRSVAAVVVV